MARKRPIIKSPHSILGFFFFFLRITYTTEDRFTTSFIINFRCSNKLNRNSKTLVYNENLYSVRYNYYD